MHGLNMYLFVKAKFEEQEFLMLGHISQTITWNLKAAR